MSTALPKSYGVLLFPGFEVLDIAGPLECLNMLVERFPPSSNHPALALSVIGRPDTADPSKALPIDIAAPKSINPNAASHAFKSAQVYQPTHTFATAPSLDVLLVPGGIGTRNPYSNCVEELEFIKRVFPSLKYIFTICTGSLLAAAAGVLDGHRATTNKAAWKTVTSFGPRTHWIAKARWVDDGKVWTTSGVSAGTDGMVAFLAKLYGEEVVTGILNGMEYVRQDDAEGDPFAEVYEVSDLPPTDG